MGTVDPSDNSISFGSAVVFESAAVEEISIVFDSSNNKVVIAYKDEGNSDYGTAIVGTVSGTSISFGSAAVFNSGNTRETHSDFDSTNNKVIIGYRDNGNSSYGTAIVGTVSGTSISFGTEVVWRSGTTDNIYVAHNPDTGTTLFTNHAADSANQGQYVIGSVSGTAISFPTDLAQYTNDGIYQPEAVYDTLAKKMVITNRNDTNSQLSKTVLTMSGTTGTADHAAGASQTVLDEDQPDYVTSTYDSSQNAVVTFYADGGNNQYLTAIVHKTAYTNENLTTENFIGTSAHAAADGAKVVVNTQGAIDENQSGLTAGQTFFVDKNGDLQLTTNTAQSVGTETVFESATTQAKKMVFDSSNNRVIIAYADSGNSNYGTAIVGSVSGTSITFGSAQVFESASILNVGFFDIAFDSNSNRVVIVYADGGNSNIPTAIVGTVDSSDNSISFGTAATLQASGAVHTDIAVDFDSNSNKVLAVYGDGGNSNYLTGIVGTVSGTSISFGTKAAVVNAIGYYLDVAFDSSNNKFAVVYSNNDSHGKAKVATISGTDVSYGSEATIASAQTRYLRAIFDSSNNKIVVAYDDQDNSTVGTAIVGTISSTDITFGTETVIASGLTIQSSSYHDLTFDSSLNKIIHFSRDGSGGDDAKIHVGTVSGTSISFGSETVINGSDAIQSVGATFDSNANKVVLAYLDEGNSNYGTAVVFTPANDLSGSLSTDAVTAGTALSATKLLVKG